MEPTAPAGALKIVGILKNAFPTYRCFLCRDGGSCAGRWAALSVRHAPRTHRYTGGGSSMTEPQQPGGLAQPPASRPYIPDYGVLDAQSDRSLLPWDWA